MEQVQNLQVAWGGTAGYGQISQWARENELGLVVPGPEQPLVDGAEVVFRKGQLGSHPYICKP